MPRPRSTKHRKKRGKLKRDGRSVTSETQPVAQNGDGRAGSVWRKRCRAGRAVDNDAWQPRTGWRWWMCRWGIDYRRWRRFCGNRVAALMALATATPMNAMKRAICCTVTARVKAVHSAKNWRSRRASISHIRRCSAGMPQSMKRRTIVKWSVCMLTWSSSFRCPGAARNQPLSGGINVNDCR